MIKLRKSELSALVDSASRDATRIHLHNVCFDGPLGAVVSTDGHRIMSRWGERFSDEKLLFSATDLKCVLKVMSTGSTAEFDGSKVTIKPPEVQALKKSRVSAKPAGFEVVARLKPVDVQFPPYLQVMDFKKGPEEDGEGDTCGFDAELFRRTMAAFSGLRKSKNQPAVTEFEIGRELAPCRLAFRDRDSGCTWVAVIMPCRLDESKMARDALSDAIETERASNEKRNSEAKEKAIALAEERAKKAREAAEEAEREAELARSRAS